MDIGVPMSGIANSIDDLQLAALLSSRICHDLVGPVGALNNGVEIVSDSGDSDLRDHAMSLIASSAKQARARLEYFRAAFGAGGSLGDSAHPSEVHGMAAAFIEGGRIQLEWTPDGDDIPRTQVRLLLNLILVGIEALPRGGLLRVGVLPREINNMIVMAEGRSAKMSPRTRMILSEGVIDDEKPLEPKEAPLLLTYRLAQSLGAELSFGDDVDRVVIAATV